MSQPQLRHLSPVTIQQHRVMVQVNYHQMTDRPAPMNIMKLISEIENEAYTSYLYSSVLIFL